MLGAQIPSFCRMIGRNKHVWSQIVRMRKSDILRRGSQTKAINMKVYIEDMYREKTDINVLFFVNKEGEITTTKMLQKHAGPELGLTNCIVYYNICKRSYKYYYYLLSTI